jgi:acetolactate synthase I/II/III large subunit
MERALYEARNGRPGPVWVDIPLDIQAVDIIPEQLEGFLAPLETQGEPTSAQISQVLNMINESKRPVVLVGNGVRLSKAEKLLLAVLDKLQIPVLTTWKAADLVPDEHLLFVGRPGSIGQRGANFTQQKSDLILVIGARLDAGQTAYNLNNFAPHARKIIVDIDSSELNKFDYQDALLINCSAHNFLEELHSLLLTEKLKTFESWLHQSQEMHTKYPVYDGRESDFPGFVNQYYLIELLSLLCDGKDVFVPGSSGACSEISMQATKLKFGQRMLNSEGLGPMGFGIPAAIGASIASSRRIITIDGDGGFQMNTQELEVIRRLNLSVKIFVLNNNGYGSIRNSQRNYFDSHFVASDPTSGLTLPSVTRIAEAYSIPSIRVDDDKMLAESINWALTNEGPTIVEVMVSPDQQTMPRTQSYQNEQGIMVTRPMEDLWPFLDRDEFEMNLRC